MTKKRYIVELIQFLYSLAMKSQTADLPRTEQQLAKNQSPLEGNLPIYKRSKNEQPIRINADDQSKFMVLLYSLTILLPLAILIIIVIFALPDATREVELTEGLGATNMAICQGYLKRSADNENYLSCLGSFTGNASNSAGRYIRDMSNLNQFLLFYFDLKPYARSQGNIKAIFSENIVFTLWAAKYEPDTKKVKAEKQTFTTVLHIEETIRSLKTKRFLLGVQSKITSGDEVYWEVTFQNNSLILSSSDFYLSTETVRKQFTIYTILLRVAFFLVSLAVFIRYSTLIIKIPKRRVSIEQKLVHVLSAFTLTFNDQLYFITVLWPNPVTYSALQPSSFVSAVFVWNFFFGFFALWAAFMIRIYYSEPDTDTVEIKRPHRIVPFVLFYLCGLAFSAAFAIIQVDEHPTLSTSNVENPFFKFLLTCTIIGFIGAAIYLIYLFVLIKQRREMLPYRHSLFMNISLLFFVGVVIVIALGSLDVFTYSSALVMLSFAIGNIYSYLLQYLYAPTRQQIEKFNNSTGDNWQNPRPFLLEDEFEKDTVDVDISLLDQKMGQNQHSLSYSSSPSSRGSVRQRMKNRRKQSNSKQSGGSYMADVGQTKEKIIKEEEGESEGRQQSAQIEYYEESVRR